MTDRCDRCGVRLGGTRYPLAALADLFPGESVNAVCERLRVSGSTLKGYMCHGVSAETADRLAARAGVPVYSVWPEMVDDHIALSEQPCVECGKGFVPKRAGMKFCERRCSNRYRMRDWSRRRYQEDPEYRERRKADSARYYGEVREYAIKRQRAYRLSKKETAA